MSNIFYSTPLWCGGDRWFDRRTTRFPETHIQANIHLSSFSFQEGERFGSYRPRQAQAYIVTDTTPKTYIPLIGSIANPDRVRDNTVWMTTNRIEFHLFAQGVTSASAVGLIHDVTSSLPWLNPKLALDFALFDDDGTVVGTHRDITLEGAEHVSADEIQDAILQEAQVDSDRWLDIVPIDFAELPATGFRIHPRTRIPVPLRTRISESTKTN